MTQQNQTADDWMDGAATKSASFNGPPPITFAGQIKDEPSLVQKRDFDSNEPVFWPDGRPKQMLQVNIVTDLRDPQDPDDDGTRALYLEFRKKEAVQEAVKRAGAKGAPKRGGWLRLTYTGDDHAARKGRNAAPKIYEADYRAPDPWAEEQAAPQQPAQQGGWGGLPPQGQQAPQGYSSQAQGGYQQQAAPPPQYQQPAIPPQGPPQGPPPQQYQQPAPAAGAAASSPGVPSQQGDPLVQFLKERNIDANVMPREQALLIATNLGYQGN